MTPSRHFLLILCITCSYISIGVYAQEKADYKIFQFPANKIPCIDGLSADWDIVPADYSIGLDKLTDDRPDSIRHRTANKHNLDATIKVGWVKGLNRLYFLYEANDDYWDFANRDQHNDILELIVDGDHSGGPFITSFHPVQQMPLMERYFSNQNAQAQNYHIFTPALDKDWAMVWGPQSWIKDLPYANAAYNYNFQPGDSGKLRLEFWITPFDYAGAEGPQRAVESILTEDKNIGLCWVVMDYDDVNKKLPANNGFWNLSPEHTVYGSSTRLPVFRLMPLEDNLRKKTDARWSFKIIDMERRLVAFKDESVGKINSWLWDFGDGTTSTSQHPEHVYKNADHYVVTLTIQSDAGTSRLSKVWDVAVK